MAALWNGVKASECVAELSGLQLGLRVLIFEAIAALRASANAPA